MDSRKKVMMYYAFEDKIGGPLVYLRQIINSKLNEKYDFTTCFQNETAGGISLKLLRRMVKKIKKESPDIVHVQGLQSEGFYGVLAAKLAGCRCIVTTVHGFAFDGQKKHGLKWFLYRYFVEPLTLRLSDRVYCVCRYASERAIIKRNVHRGNCGFIHNAAGDLTVTRGREQVRQQWNISLDEVVFVIVGRISADKGFDILGRAVKLLNGSCANMFRLMVVGGGEYRQSFEEYMQEEIKSGQVILVGPTDHVADYLGASDIFILPSYHENLPIALLEAGKMGLPCIVSNVGGMPEVVRDGITGFLIDDSSAESYVHKMKTLLTDALLRQKMGQAMLDEIECRFSMSLMCNRIDEVYSDVLRKKELKY